jgi:hypothetical protein
LQDDNQESRMIRCEFYFRCCKNTLRFWYPKLAFSSIRLDCYKIFRMIEMKNKSQFLQKNEQIQIKKKKNENSINDAANLYAMEDASKKS